MSVGSYMQSMLAVIRLNVRWDQRNANFRFAIENFTSACLNGRYRRAFFFGKGRGH